MEKPEFEIAEFPINQDQLVSEMPDFDSGQYFKLFKIEWLIMGALIFVAIVAWAELLQVVITLYMTGESESNPYSRFVYASAITLITVLAIWFFEREHRKHSSQKD